jgi:hypothetical protein
MKLESRNEVPKLARSFKKDLGDKSNSRDESFRSEPRRRGENQQHFK